MGCPGPITGRSALTCTGEVSFDWVRKTLATHSRTGLSIAGGMPSR